MEEEIKSDFVVDPLSYRNWNPKKNDEGVLDLTDDSVDLRKIVNQSREYIRWIKHHNLT